MEIINTLKFNIQPRERNRKRLLGENTDYVNKNLKEKVRLNLVNMGIKMLDSTFLSHSSVECPLVLGLIEALFTILSSFAF